MKRGLRIALLLCAGAVGVKILIFYLFYDVIYPTYIWNQKLTLAVDTPGSVKTGSSVVNISVEFQPGYWISPDGVVVRRLRGEATVVDLGGGRYRFALVTSGPSAR